MGDPSQEQTSMGSVISHDHRDKVESYIRLAVEEGGRILTGGTSADAPVAGVTQGVAGRYDAIPISPERFDARARRCPSVNTGQDKRYEELTGHGASRPEAIGVNPPINRRVAAELDVYQRRR